MLIFDGQLRLGKDISSPAKRKNNKIKPKMKPVHLGRPMLRLKRFFGIDVNNAFYVNKKLLHFLLCDF